MCKHINILHKWIHKNKCIAFVYIEFKHYNILYIMYLFLLLLFSFINLYLLSISLHTDVCLIILSDHIYSLNYMMIYGLFIDFYIHLCLLKASMMRNTADRDRLCFHLIVNKIQRGTHLSSVSSATSSVSCAALPECVHLITNTHTHT